MAAEHEELENGIAALVLGSVEAEERARLLAHLQACSSCRELAARLGRLTVVLPLEPDPVQPPARLRGRVMAAVRAAGDADPPQRRRLVVTNRRRFPVLRPGLGLGTAAAVIAAFVLGGGIGLGLSRAQPGSPAPAEVQRYALHGTGSMAGVQANAVSLTRDRLTLVDFRDMPPTPPGHVYEVWTITADGRALPAGVFTPDADGSRTVVLSRDVQGATELAVTIEAGPNGAQAPSQTPQLVGRIA